MPDPFLYNLHGYPLWRKCPEVVAVFDLPQAKPLRTLYGLLASDAAKDSPPHEAGLALCGVQSAAVTLAWSRMFAAEDQAYVGGKLEDFLVKHPIPEPRDFAHAVEIGRSLAIGQDSHPVRGYCFSFQALDCVRRILPEAEKWEKMLREKTGRQEWYNRDGKGRLKWLDR